jgi:hypothetical protein
VTTVAKATARPPAESVGTGATIRSPTRRASFEAGVEAGGVSSLKLLRDCKHPSSQRAGAFEPAPHCVRTRRDRSGRSPIHAHLPRPLKAPAPARTRPRGSEERGRKLPTEHPPPAAPPPSRWRGDRAAPAASLARSPEHRELAALAVGRAHDGWRRGRSGRRAEGGAALGAESRLRLQGCLKSTSRLFPRKGRAVHETGQYQVRQSPVVVGVPTPGIGLARDGSAGRERLMERVVSQLREHLEVWLQTSRRG